MLPAVGMLLHSSTCLQLHVCNCTDAVALVVHAVFMPVADAE